MQSDLSTTNSRFSAVWGRRQQVCWLWSLQQKLRTNVFISLQVIYVLVCWCSGRTTDVSSSTCSDRFQYVHRMILDAGVGLQHQELIKSRCSLLQLFPVMLRQLQRIRLHSRGFKSQTTEHFQVSSGTITRWMIKRSHTVWCGSAENLHMIFPHDTYTHQVHCSLSVVPRLLCRNVTFHHRIWSFYVFVNFHLHFILSEPPADLNTVTLIYQQHCEFLLF